MSQTEPLESSLLAAMRVPVPRCGFRCRDAGSGAAMRVPVPDARFLFGDGDHEPVRRRVAARPGCDRAFSMSRLTALSSSRARPAPSGDDQNREVPAGVYFATVASSNPRRAGRVVVIG